MILFYLVGHSGTLYSPLGEMGSHCLPKVIGWMGFEEYISFLKSVGSQSWLETDFKYYLVDQNGIS